MQKDAKSIEGRASVFQSGDESAGKKAGDEHMSSAEVGEVISQRGARAKPVVSDRK